jgi:hypothetical protein
MGWIAKRLGIPDPVTAIMKYFAWGFMVVIGIVALTVGVIVLIMSTRVARNLAGDVTRGLIARRLGGGEGEGAAPVVNVHVTPVPGPPGPPGRDAIEPPHRRPEPLFPPGDAKRLGPGEDSMRESLRKPERVRKLRRKADVGDALL